jgi:hypothetical protein
MRGARRVSIALFTVILWAFAPAAHASLIGQTFNADISILGEDDNGFYTISLLNGPVSIPGPGDLVVTVPFFKQLTFGGFTVPSDQIKGNVTLDIDANKISVTMSGQVQVLELNSAFTGIGGTIIADVDSATGLIAGVSEDFSHSFTPSSVDFTTFYLGPNSGTNVTQTETLTFASVAAVAEPSSFLLFVFGLLGLGLVFRPKVT